jgi:hypothetical protein
VYSTNGRLDRLEAVALVDAADRLHHPLDGADFGGRAVGEAARAARLEFLRLLGAGHCGSLKRSARVMGAGGVFLTHGRAGNNRAAWQARFQKAGAIGHPFGQAEVMRPGFSR